MDPHPVIAGFVFYLRFMVLINAEGVEAPKTIMSEVFVGPNAQRNCQRVLAHDVAFEYRKRKRQIIGQSMRCEEYGSLE